MHHGKRSITPAGFDKPRPGWPSIKKAEKIPVIVVDDDRQILEMISTVLTHYLGFRVTKAGNAFEALSSMEQKTFKVVITDFQMPGMDGLVLASTIKKRDPGMIIILLTGVNRDVLEGKTELKDIDLVIHKPFKLGKLLDKIGGIVDRH